MNLLRITAKNFRNCRDDFSIDFVAKADKSDEDMVYELQEIAPGLYTFNNMAFVGKNASGKTTAIELIASCYRILDEFQISDNNYFNNNEELEIFFFHEGSIYKYTTKLLVKSIRPDVFFENEHIYMKKYNKRKAGSIFENSDFKEMNIEKQLPPNISILYYILENISNNCIYCSVDLTDSKTDFYKFSFDLIDEYRISLDVFNCILKLFDNNVKNLERQENGNYLLNYKGSPLEMSSAQLKSFLSSGTTKGIETYIAMAVALSNGMGLIIDEIEDHFHKTLVENMISLFKEPLINKKHATLIFTTHYCELLDMFHRKDNIWITKSDKQVYIENLFEKYNDVPDGLKSEQFYNNVFDTAVNYDDLMALKKALKRGASK
ncbi:MAG: ATP-binding protein [Oscillospiraceae bacterium]|nr:ATP-binding protein [Oscillospiraceae bacterium]